MSQRFVTTVTGRSPGDHVCWPFHGTAEYLDAAREYVAEGLDRRELVSYVKIGTSALSHAVVHDVAQVDVVADDGRPELNRLPVPQGWTTATTATHQIDRMTRTAVAQGYTGLRLLTDVNELVRGADGRPEWVRSEHLLDRYALEHPLTALCGYDVDELGHDVVAEAARVHALTRGAVSPFLLRATDPRGGLALTGEVDCLSADDLHRAVLMIGPEIPARVTVSLAELDFIDHQALLALDGAAGLLGVTMTLVDADPLSVWLVDALALRSITTEVAP